MIKTFSYFLIAVLAYYLSGKLGLLLAIPPGFASAVWPASGVALACILAFDKVSVASGVALGSFLLNFGVASHQYTDMSWGVAIPAIAVAMGSMLQVQAGGYLFRRFIGFPSAIDSPSDIIRFVLIIAPVGCLVSATVGVTSLYLNHLIEPENYLFSWATWWIGDTIGVLLFTPLLINLFCRQEHLVKSRKIQVVMPTILVFMGVLGLYFASSESRRQIMESEIEDNARHYFSMIEEELKISRNKLSGYLAFYNASEHVTREEFDAFSKIQLERDRILHGVGWTEIVPASERERYESEIRAAGIKNFSFTELTSEGELKIAQSREHYYPVLYIYPLESNKKALGLNLAANQERLKALVQARDQSRAIATAPIRLVQESGSQLGIILYLPVFCNKFDPVHQSEIDGGEHFRGYISGVYRVANIFGNIIDKANQNHYGVTINDVTEPGKPVSLISSKQAPLKQFEPKRHIIDFGGRKLKVNFYPTSQFKVLSRDWASWIILTSGFLFAAMLQSFILMITGNAENTKQEVERKTKALFEAKQMAEEANKAKSNFTANISHEIRTPLNAIIGLINLCLKTTLSGQQNNYLQKAKLASGTLLSLINQTLDYSKIEAGKLELEQIKFDLPGVLQKVEAIFSAQAIQQGIDFSVEFPHLLPRFLLGDQLRLEQVLLNLCSNAFKFTEKGKVELHLEIESQTNTKVTLNFIVSDTGIGIPVEQQKNLFESFHQADSSTSRKFGGSGLGLAITKQIVEHMGGTIYLVSEENKGSQFYVKVELPLADESEFVSKESIAINYDTTAAYSSTTSSPQLNITDPITVDLINNDKKDPGATGRLLDNVSILLVEDILINQMIAQEILQEHGAKVITAENGLKALQELSDGQSFDAILMDIQMPEMDGYEATRKIRENEQFCHIPIIAMTANALATDIEQCKAAGMDDHIAKPFEEEDVLNKVLSHLNSTSLKIIS